MEDKELTELLDNITIASDEPEAEVEPVAMASMDSVNPDANDVYSYLGIDGDSPKDLEFANEIYEYARTIAASEEPADILWAVRDLSHSLRSPEFGGSKLKSLYTYVKLQQQRSSIDKKIKAYEAE